MQTRHTQQAFPASLARCLKHICVYAHARRCRYTHLCTCRHLHMCTSMLPHVLWRTTHTDTRTFYMLNMRHTHNLLDFTYAPSPPRTRTHATKWVPVLATYGVTPASCDPPPPRSPESTEEAAIRMWSCINPNE